MAPLRLLTRASALGLVCLLGVAACSDDSGKSTASKVQDQAKQVAGDVKDSANDAAARAVAESYRAALKAKGGGQSLRTITLLNDVKGTLPGSPDISGITDGDGDGKDDDGKVQVKVNNGQACVTVPATGDLVDVTGGSC
ncbi:MAG: hypothetical protein JWL70_952 [Acidimicrobiia bacterium]|nr:hypothetical protein [Acidimicrobiia bacterium]